MAVCDYCNKSFNLFGVHDDGYSFCSAKCRNQAQGLLLSLGNVPAADIESYIERVHAGPCSKCSKPNPVDLYRSYRVVSMLILTRWTTRNHFVCRACARREQLKALLYSTLLGWWGFPFGLIVTPIQIVRNIVGLSGGGIDPRRPSDRLRRLLKLTLARQSAAQTQPG
jgi:hypothetical protein